MNTVELIRKKRENFSLSEEEFRWMISGYVQGVIPDYQMSSFLMACYFRGMSEEETLTFTRLMLHSGEVIDLSEIPGMKVDKHSTGGVGDKVSLILAPIVAACGVPVPMISGRGLGHTGGTLDKLESIPGFRTNLSITEYKKVIKAIGLVMIGQTAEIAPADKKMYALRDVTATVECIPLIAGSIMSKKLAEGIDALVLDVKTGRGAFMQTYESSLELAQTLIRVGNGFGKETVAFITDMSQPLGIAIGNWLEVVESVECLCGLRGNSDHSSDLMEVTSVLAGAMLMLGKRAKTIDEGIALAKQSIKDGSAYRKFLDLVRTQGGDVSALENLERYPLSKHSIEIKASEDGYIAEIDSLELGLTGIELGAGRARIDDVIDPKAGIVLKKKVGDAVETNDTVAIFYTDKETALHAAKERIAKAFRIQSVPLKKKPMIVSYIDKSGVREWKK
ncbi:MAG: thymidine phosphorylase [Ignavibacteriales bacterium]|nr:thymidine phosphorylase [Ignavibacteriales bacterium]